MNSDKLKDQMFPWKPIEETRASKKHNRVRFPDKTLTLLADFTEFCPNGCAVHEDDKWVVAGYRINGKWYIQYLEADPDIYPTHFMPLDTPEKLAAALRIAVEALEKRASVALDYDAHEALIQIEEVLE